MNLEKFINRETGTTIFPFSWRAGLLETLYSLSKMGYGNNKRLSRAWDVLKQHRTENGKYILDWTPAKNNYMKPGKRKEESKWVTFYAYLCYKYKNSKVI